jgi:ribosome-binding factor A
MKRKHPARSDMFLSCDRIGPEDGVDPRLQSHDASNRSQGRKALQLCRQVERTLNHLLAWDTGDERLADLIVQSVVPAPNASRLLVLVSAPGTIPLADVLAGLARHAGRLRSAVAQSIHRRRTPELAFRIVHQD